MKKIMTFIAFTAFTTIAAAQQNTTAQDSMRRQVPGQTQRIDPTPVSAAPVDANTIRAKSETEFQATKRAKDKGSTQKVTTAERPVSDSIKDPKEVRPQVGHDKPSY